MSDLHKILTKALNDPKYAATLKANPEEAMKQVGVEATPERTAALNDSANSLARAQHCFSGQKPY